MQTRSPASVNPPGNIQGVDLDFNFGGIANACTGTLVANERVGETEFCSVAFLTAGHCLTKNGNAFKSMTVILKPRGLGEDFTITNKPGGSASRFYGSVDSGLVRGDVPCDRVARIPVATLALGEKPVIGERLSIARRQEKVVADGKLYNPGGGQTVTGTLQPNAPGTQWMVAGLDKGGIYAADSGAGVEDEHGHLFSVLSRGDASYKSDFALVDSQVPEWAANVLKGWGMDPRQRRDNPEVQSFEPQLASMAPFMVGTKLPRLVPMREISSLQSPNL
ncbi:hypothetical protein K2X33_09800 [bacterium]|nr:hypothetical protein [bacterium]